MPYWVSTTGYRFINITKTIVISRLKIYYMSESLCSIYLTKLGINAMDKLMLTAVIFNNL